MEIIKKSLLSISDCCEVLNIEKENLPDALQKINEPKDIIYRLKNLLDEDKEAFESCSTIEEYKKYIAEWPDGLHRKKANERIVTFIIIEAEETFYQNNKNTVSGLNAYIKKYPNGKFIHEAMGRLPSLNIEDRHAFESCSTIEQYKEYLTKWTDGLFKKEAERRIKLLEIKKDKSKILTSSGFIIWLITYLIGISWLGETFYTFMLSVIVTAFFLFLINEYIKDICKFK